MSVSSGAYTLSGLKLGSGTVKSATKPSDDFTNSDTILCPVTFSLVNSDETAFAGNYASIDADGYVVLNEANFDGTSVTLKVKAITDFGTALYKEIIIADLCPTLKIYLTEPGTNVDLSVVKLGTGTTLST